MAEKKDGKIRISIRLRGSGAWKATT